MSELTSCNYCTKKRIEAHAKKEGKKTTMVGLNLYTHPKNVNIRKLRGKQREKYFTAWFMELTTTCVC